MSSSFNRFRHALLREAIFCVISAVGLFCQAAEVLGGSSAAWQAIANGAPVRVAVFMDKGARNQGAFYHLWLATIARNVNGFPVDAQMIRDGILDKTDVLVIPGGSSVTEAKTLGSLGARKIKDFIFRGGGYIGTCAGCVILSESTKSHPNMFGILPFKSIFSRERADISITFNADAQRIVGIKPGKSLIRYSLGPVFVPAHPVSNAQFTVIGTYNGFIDFHAKGPRELMNGKAAAFAGTYGAGRVFASAVHPEYAPATRHLLQDAFRYVTRGRALEWVLPQRKRGQLVVGIQTDNTFGVAAARFVQDLIRKQEFDLIGVNEAAIGDGALRKLDALLVGDVADFQSGKGCLSLLQRARVNEFLARGGRLIAWGSAAKPCREKLGPAVRVVENGEAACTALRAFAAEPLPAAEKVVVKKIAKPVRAAVYTDTAGSNYLLAGSLLLSPDYEVTFVTGKQIAEGALNGMDLLLQPGGGCHRQILTLGEKGTAAITNFVYNGGRFYGVCAGAFMASQPLDPATRPRLGLVPWKNDADKPYRGTAELPLAITPEGRAIFGPSAHRKVQYYGGPVLVPGTPIPDTDIHVFATYDAYNISTFSAAEPTPMRGKAALLGGRVGKGKVFVSCPHPEFHEYSYDIALSGLGYLTGHKPVLPTLDRVRGALEVGFKLHVDNGEETRFYFMDLMADRRFHINTGITTGSGLSHKDVVVLPHPTKNDVSYLIKRFAQTKPVIALASTAEEREHVKALANVQIVSTYAEIIQRLAALRDAP